MSDIDLGLPTSTSPNRAPSRTYLAPDFKRNCHRCSLSCDQAVFGYGPRNPKLLIVSDYPGRQELKQDKPFVGESGKFLRACLKLLVGLDMDTDCYVTNVLKCPPTEKGVTAGDRSACMLWLRQELNVIPVTTPVLICGGQAMRAMIPSLEKTEIVQARLRIHTFNQRRMMVTWNPAYVESFRFKADESDPTKWTSYTGSMGWHFRKDLAFLKDWLTKLGVSLAETKTALGPQAVAEPATPREDLSSG